MTTVLHCNLAGGDIGFDVGYKTSGACRVGSNTRTPSAAIYSRKRRQLRSSRLRLDRPESLLVGLKGR